MNSIYTRSCVIVRKQILTIVSVFAIWLFCYAIYYCSSSTRSYSFEFTNLTSSLRQSFIDQDTSLWGHVAATLRRSFFVSAVSLIAGGVVSCLLCLATTSKYTKSFVEMAASLLDTCRSLPITMLYVLLAFSLQLGSEFSYILIPLPTLISIIASGFYFAYGGRSLAREHFYKSTFKRLRFLRLTLPEILRGVLSDIKQMLLYAVLLISVLEYVQEPLNRQGIGAFYRQLFDAPPAPELVFPSALPPLMIIASIAIFIATIFDIWSGSLTFKKQED